MEFYRYNRVFYIFVLPKVGTYYGLNILVNFHCNKFSIVACISKNVHSFWCST